MRVKIPWNWRFSLVVEIQIVAFASRHRTKGYLFFAREQKSMIGIALNFLPDPQESQVEY